MQEEQADADRKIVMCRKVKQLNNSLHIVEISLTDTKMLISAVNTTSSESILVEVPHDKSKF